MDQHRLVETVRRSWLGGVSLQSDFARSHASYVGSAASMGLITTKTGPMTFGSIWRPTSVGLQFVESYDEEQHEIQLELPL